jgi:microcystin-dependent protein
MAGFLGTDFIQTSPADNDPVAEGAAQIRDIKQRLKTFCGVFFDLETGLPLRAATSMTLASSPPSNPQLGDLYYDLVQEQAFIFLSSGWTSLVKAGLPIGTVVPFAGTIAQITSSFTNIGGEWQHANGDAISRTTYSDLFNLIGTTYGPGDTTTTFNIPDFRDHFIVGANSDSAGQAKTTVTDGSTLTKSRAWTAHNHGVSVSENYNGNGGTRSFANASDDTPRAIPPFVAQAMVIRIK